MQAVEKHLHFQNKWTCTELLVDQIEEQDMQIAIFIIHEC